MNPKEFAFEQMNNSPALIYLSDMGHRIEEVQWPPRLDGYAMVYRVRCPECRSSFEFRKVRLLRSPWIEWARVDPESDVWTDACESKQFQRVRQEGNIRFW